MSFRFRTVIIDGASLAASRNGVVLMVLVALAELFSVLLFLSAGSVYVPLGDGVVGVEGAPTPGEELPEALAGFATFFAGVLGAILTVPITIIAIRTFVGSERDTIPDEYIFHRLGRATLSAYLAGLVLFFGYILAFVLPFVPLYWLFGEVTGLPLVAVLLLMLVVGLTLAVFFWISLLFVTYEIAVRDTRVVGALRGSWRLTSGTRLRLFALAVVLAGVQWAAVGPLVPFASEMILLTLSVPFSAVVGIVAIAIYARVYYELAEFGTDSSFIDA
jgi:hypothetical protein